MFPVPNDIILKVYFNNYNLSIARSLVNQRLSLKRIYSTVVYTQKHAQEQRATQTPWTNKLKSNKKACKFPICMGWQPAADDIWGASISCHDSQLNIFLHRVFCTFKRKKRHSLVYRGNWYLSTSTDVWAFFVGWFCCPLALRLSALAGIMQRKLQLCWTSSKSLPRGRPLHMQQPQKCKWWIFLNWVQSYCVCVLLYISIKKTAQKYVWETFFFSSDNHFKSVYVHRK